MKVLNQALSLRSNQILVYGEIYFSMKLVMSYFAWCIKLHVHENDCLQVVICFF